MRTTALISRLILAGAATALAACQAPSNVPASALKASGEKTSTAYIRLPAELVTKDFVKATGFNRDHKRDASYAFGYLKQTALDRLDGGVRAQVDELDARVMAHYDVDTETLRIRDEARDASGDRAAEDYHDYTALTAELKALVTAHPGLATLESAGKSVQGRELWYLKISDNAAVEEGEPKLLYIANMHGDETVGREMMIYLARYLLNEYDANDRVKTLVNNAQIFLMPSMNPDGFELDQRENAAGVDLNRDFPDFTSDNHDTTAGRAIETQAIMRLHERHHFLMALNFHGGEVCFNLPWDTQPNDGSVKMFGDDALIKRAGYQYASTNPSIFANDWSNFDHGVTYGYEWYEVDGGMQDWSIWYRNAIHATVELSTTKWPGKTSLPRMWEENRESLLRFLEDGTKGVHLNIVSSRGDAVTKSSVRVSSLDREVLYTAPKLSRPALDGEQTVTIKAEGYQDKTLTVATRPFDGTFTDVTLTPR